MSREFLGSISPIITHFSTITKGATYTESSVIALEDYGYPQRVVLLLATDIGASATVDAKIQCDASGSYADISGATASLTADGMATAVEVAIPAGSQNLKVLARSQTADSEVACGIILGEKKERSS